jgi:hypothetical protein
VITCDVGVAIGIDSDGLACVITMGRAIVMPNPNLISIRSVFDRGDVIVRTGFHALTGNINVA